MEKVQDSQAEDASPAETRAPKERVKEEDYLLRLKYLQADFENYRKRTEKEMLEVEEASARKVAVKLLAVLDELDLAMQHSGKAEGSQLREGVEMVYRKLNGVLESLGLERIKCVGEPFDPTLHEAVERVQGSGKEDLVSEEMRSGFTFRGQVLRPSMVKVELARQRVGMEGSK